MSVRYPVALIGSDEVPVVYSSFDQLVQDVEPQDVNDYFIVDSAGDVFRIAVKKESPVSFLDKLLSALGAPERYEFRSAPGALPRAIVVRAKSLLIGSGGEVR